MRYENDDGRKEKKNTSYKNTNGFNSINSKRKIQKVKLHKKNISFNLFISFFHFVLVFMIGFHFF